ncbi:Trp family transcriptional regulator [Sphaerochaeta sp. S2]|jgi:TrpR family trp operon transcriptional repressor|uniref:Trp family transcriptional regulator n=1 Tax=Sphaerochaeta sp. S2 TaxID=2798868 RepID=UPI0018E9BD27|nr:Trp family transcriptional regulator [Sphaerochaeta sp. S2]MCK9349485.1 trp operon repressor [Sphaerochaeta sp.]MDC7229148.1 Trp family transcriptional regulator [Sphaerochaetaceae bacterium]MBJ2357643.1 transcriptional regulator [Sphaerochaeta sp. S2]MDD4302234.1 Trp family transcriptional regulator [Sphaerochaeta sp.]MDD4574630.1 Trp family transcriptional regulator [Sphaerochaeta sp.]
MDTEYKDLIEVFSATNNPEDMAKLFEEMLTPSERKAILLRWNLMKDLYQGLPQREIASSYGISLCKITRGSKILKQKDSYCKKILSDRYDDHLHI